MTKKGKGNSFPVDASLLQSKGYAAIRTDSDKCPFLHTCEITVGDQTLYIVQKVNKMSKKRTRFGQYLNMHDAALIGAVVEQHAFIDFNDLKGLRLFMKQLVQPAPPVVAPVVASLQLPSVVASPYPNTFSNQQSAATLLALPMPSAGKHLASIEMRINGKSFKHMSVKERLKQLEKDLDVVPLSDMSIEERIQRIEAKATLMDF